VIHGATGLWNWGFAPASFGPDGDGPHPEFTFDEWLTDGQQGQLIGFVGDNPYNQGQNAPGFFAVGTATVGLTGLSGSAELWLGFNDDFGLPPQAIFDNTGSVTVQVDFGTAPVGPGSSSNTPGQNGTTPGGGVNNNPVWGRRVEITIQQGVPGDGAADLQVNYRGAGQHQHVNGPATATDLAAVLESLSQAVGLTTRREGNTVIVANGQDAVFTVQIFNANTTIPVFTAKVFPAP
jgi:hypothetical protein